MIRRTLFAALAAMLAATPAAAQEWTVKATAIVEHQALDAVRVGARAALETRGYAIGEDIAWEFQSAQGDVGIAGQIARTFVGESPDVILAIATPSAQAAVSAARGRVPVIFSAVTDPVDARLVASLDAPGGNVTGVSDMTPVDRHIEMMLEAMPDLERLGVPYNPGEANAAVLVERIQAVAPAYGLEVVTASAPSSADVLAATRSLVGQVDAIYVTTDNTLMSAFESVAQVGMDADLPVFAADTSVVERGAAAAAGFDYHDIGLQTGEIIARVLEGEDVGSIPVQFVDRTLLHVNLGAAAEMGLELPAAFVESADRVLE